MWLVQISTKSTQQYLMAKVSAQRENRSVGAVSPSPPQRGGWELTPMGWVSWGELRQGGEQCEKLWKLLLVKWMGLMSH